MSLYARLAGAALIALSALIAGRGYASYTGRRISEEEGLVTLLSHIKSEISCYLTPQSKLIDAFRCEGLEPSGFLSAMREGGGLLEAYRSCEEKMYCSDGVKEIISRFFEGFGKGYKDEELARLDAALASLMPEVERDRVELEKNQRVATALLVSAALGLIILLL